MQSGTKCGRIVETLAAEIAEGRYRAPSSFPSAEQIVRRFKVAYLTAVKAHDELKRRGLVYSVQGAGTYVARAAGRSVGLVVPGWSGSDFFPALCRSVSAVCQRSSRPLLFADMLAESGEGLAARLVSIARSFVDAGVGGVLFHPVDFCADGAPEDAVEPPARAPGTEASAARTFSIAAFDEYVALVTASTRAALGASAADALYVGDSEVDADTAKRAGLAFRLCSWGFRPREALEALGPVLDAPGELLALFPGTGAADA